MLRLLELTQNKNKKHTTNNSIRAVYEVGWGLVRASNTTPTQNQHNKTKTKSAKKQNQNENRAVMLKVDPALALPF